MKWKIRPYTLALPLGLVSAWLLASACESTQPETPVAAAKGVPSIDLPYVAALDKIKQRPVEQVFTYQSSFRSVFDSRYALELLLPSLVGGVRQGARISWSREETGFSGELYGRDRIAMTRVYDNGFFLANFSPLVNEGGAEVPSSLETDFAYLVARAYVLARRFGALGDDPSCLPEVDESVEWPDRAPVEALQRLLLCPTIDATYASHGSYDEPVVAVNINRRIPVGVMADGRKILGSLRGAGFRAVFDGPRSLAGIEVRPLAVDLASPVAVSVPMTPGAARDAVRDVIRQPGFDLVGMLNNDPMLGYTTESLPVDSAALSSAGVMEHTVDRKSDYVPLPDPALPPPLLRPAWLHGVGSPIAPVEPLAIPADAPAPRIARIEPVFENDQAVAYRARLSRDGTGAVVDWSTITADGKLYPMGRGEAFDGLARLPAGRPVVALLRRADGAVLQSVVVETPSPMTDTRMALPQFASTDSTGRVLTPNTPTAERFEMPHFDPATRSFAANLLPGVADRTWGNYVTVTSIGPTYKATVDKLRSSLPLGRSRMGEIMSSQAITHWGMIVDYETAGGAAGTFRTDLCRLDPRKGEVVCFGNFGLALDEPVEKVQTKSNGAPFFYLDQKYEIDVGCEHPIGTVLARMFHDPSRRPDGGPSLAPGPFSVYQGPSEQAAWLTSSFFFSGTAAGFVDRIDRSNFVTMWPLGAEMPEMRTRLFALGRTRPAVQSSVHLSFKPGSGVRVRDLARVCKALGTSRLPFIDTVDGDLQQQQPYCTGPAAAANARLDTSLIMQWKDVRFFTNLEIVPSFSSLNMLAREGRGIVPTIEATLGDGSEAKQKMTNMARLSYFSANVVASEVVDWGTGAMSTSRPLPESQTVRPRFSRRNGGGRTVWDGGGDAWDNAHLKDHTPVSTIGHVVPGNVVVPGCTPPFPYFVSGAHPGNLPDIRTVLAGDVQRQINLFAQALVSWTYQWDPRPDCIHRHSNWAHASNGFTGLFFDQQTYHEIKWSFISAGYSGDLAHYRPTEEGWAHRPFCTKLKNAARFNPPGGSVIEDAYTCEPTKFVESAWSTPVAPGHWTTMHLTPTFFTE